jgi:subtilisin family serine protease
VRAAGTDSLTPSRVEAIVPADSATGRARKLYLALAERGLTSAVIDDAMAHFQSDLEHGLNPSFDPRPIVGDNYRDVHQSHYGNADITGPDASHGTHVSGIIGATRDDHDGVNGIGEAVRIMMVRAIPDGDERDKDVANAIRFAVDHGARIINMSFGKAFSPDKPVVDAAVRYADAHGVLMVHAAGNDGVNEDVSSDYPSPRYADGGQAQNWIEVGASSWQGGDSLAASFSNYSHDRVDVFAPGVDIMSTLPGNHFGRESGTSMAAPVVSGVAALLLAYYPTLTAPEVKRIILASATRYTDQMVVRPGSSKGEHVPFGSLSATGGIVNAYAALRMAGEVAHAKR